MNLRSFFIILCLSSDFFSNALPIFNSFSKFRVVCRAQNQTFLFFWCEIFLFRFFKCYFFGITDSPDPALWYRYYIQLFVPPLAWYLPCYIALVFSIRFENSLCLLYMDSLVLNTSNAPCKCLFHQWISIFHHSSFCIKHSDLIYNSQTTVQANCFIPTF